MATVDSTIVTQTVTPPGTDLDAAKLIAAGPAGQDIFRERIQVCGKELDQVGAVKSASTQPLTTDPAPVHVIGPNTYPAAVTTGFSGSIAGNVATSAVAEFAVNETTFVEQTTGAQRSFSSSSAADTAAGTGARTIQLTYYVLAAGVVTGPFTETITMNGVTAVNTVATNITLVEKFEVITAGTGGVNAGIITMFAAAAAAGGAIASIAVGDRRTNYAHHYVASGRTCLLTDFYTMTTVSSAQLPQFSARSLDYATTNAAERILFDNAAQIGSSSRTQTSFLHVPRRVTGPARIQFYVTTTVNTSQTAAVEASYYEIT